jgi:hypothetical protein
MFCKLYTGITSGLFQCICSSLKRFVVYYKSYFLISTQYIERKRLCKSLKKLYIRSSGPGNYCCCCCCYYYYYYYYFGFSRQGSLCKPGWPWTQKSACLCLRSAGIKGVHHHCPAVQLLVSKYPSLKWYVTHCTIYITLLNILKKSPRWWSYFHAQDHGGLEKVN